MLESLSRNWWLIVLRGVLAVAVGVAAFVMPGVTVGALVLLFGVFALVDGLFAIGSAFTGRVPGGNTGAVIARGLLGVAAGVVTLIWPGVTEVVLVALLAAWAVVTGVLEVIVAVRLRREVVGELWLGLGGVLSVAFGLLVLFCPVVGVVFLAWMVGIYAVLWGVTLILFGLRLRRLDRRGLSDLLSTR